VERVGSREDHDFDDAAANATAPIVVLIRLAMSHPLLSLSDAV
jgi:hypothetical protein